MQIARKPAKISNHDFLNALLYLIENGCKWRALSKELGNWHTIYVKFNRWSKNGTIQRIFEELQKENIIDIQSDALCIDSTSIKVHPDVTWAKKQAENNALAVQKGANNENTCDLYFRKIRFKISTFCKKSSRCTGRQKLINSIGFKAGSHLLMDRACEDDETRALVLEQGLIPIVPPKKNRKTPWKYDTELYKRRN